MIARHAMWRAGDRVGVGVSGGADSVGLLRILQEVSAQQGIRLAVLHFNHGLRGADSDGDEQFVAALAEHLQIPFFPLGKTWQASREPNTGTWRTPRAVCATGLSPLRRAKARS